MKILMIPSRMLPIPPVKGGAVQNLINFYIEWNEKEKNNDLIVTSIYNEDAKNLSSELKNTVIEYTGRHRFLIKLMYKDIPKISGLAHKIINADYKKIIKKVIRQNKEKLDLVVLDNSTGYFELVRKEFDGKIAIHIYNDHLNSSVKNIDYIMKNVDRVITVSEYNSDIVRKLGYEEKVVTLHNGVDISRFGNEYTKGQRNGIREKLNIKDDEIAIIFVARLVPEKGIMELIKAFSKITEYTNLRLEVIGNKLYDGNVRDEFYEKLVSEAAKSLNKIDFLGYVGYDELPLYYSAADIAVLPSTYEEPFAMAAIEYMASELPVIVTNSGGLPEMVADTAIVVNKEENLIDNLKAAMLRLVSSKELCRDLGNRAKERAKLFDSRLYCEKLDKIFIDIINEKG